MVQFIVGLAILAVIVLVMRLFGAWMLRIDEVIKYQKEILSELKKANSNKELNR